VLGWSLDIWSPYMYEYNVDTNPHSHELIDVRFLSTTLEVRYRSFCVLEYS
jgi:hypothetical protein